MWTVPTGVTTCVLPPRRTRSLDSTNAFIGAARCDVRLDGYGVLLRIELPNENEGHIAADVDLVLKAIRLAQVHVLERTPTHRRMTFTADEGWPQSPGVCPTEPI